MKNYTVTTDTGTAKTVKLEWYDGKVSHAKMTNEYFNIFTNPKYMNIPQPQKSAIVVECPYCHSTNTKKISAARRILSTELFGLGSKKIGKQWHCNKCGSDF